MTHPELFRLLILPLVLMTYFPYVIMRNEVPIKGLPKLVYYNKVSLYRGSFPYILLLLG